MTFEEMQLGLRGLQDNMTVQGVMMDRRENNLQRLEAATIRLLKIAESHEKRLAADCEGLRLMQAAMAALFECMDRFIRGLESDGHKRRGKE